MPTGYTAELMENGVSFQEFVLKCARAFGACIEMRDESLDVPIPEKFPVSTYHRDAVATAKRELANLDKMTPKQRVAFGMEQKAKVVTGARQYYEKALAEDARLDAMAKFVEAWRPPSKDHEGLKKFMLEQIASSRHGQYNGLDTLRTAEAKSPATYWQEARHAAKRSVDYHTKEQESDKRRAEGNTEWVRQLRESL